MLKHILLRNLCDVSPIITKLIKSTMKNNLSTMNNIPQKLCNLLFVTQPQRLKHKSIHFILLLLTISVLFLLPHSISASGDHFEAKSSLDSDENIGKSIDKWPSFDSNSSSLESNSTSVIQDR